MALQSIGADNTFVSFMVMGISMGDSNCLPLHDLSDDLFFKTLEIQSEYRDTFLYFDTYVGKAFHFESLFSSLKLRSRPF